MIRIVTAAFALAAILAAPRALAQQSPAPSGSGPPAGGRHLVYQFGYNTKAASQGQGTGTTTVDIGGVAKDGGTIVTATDDWWNTVKPRQSYTCEVYPNGGVTCPQAPYAISPIQMALVPLFGQNYFAPLSAGPTSSWNQAYNVRATFFPGANTGFAGQVYTWNCTYALTGKGTIPNAAPLIMIQSAGTMKQQGGRYITVNQKANIAFDPRINIPVLVYEELNFVPQLTVNQYTVELKLIRD